MKTLTEWIEQKINDKDIKYFNYNEFKSLKEENWEHCEIGVVTLKSLWNDSETFESYDDENFAIKVRSIKIKYSVTKIKFINLSIVCS